MFQRGTRRDFIARSGSLVGAGLLASAAPQAAKAVTTKGSHDFVIVEGHRDIWELSGRIRLPEKEQHSPIANFLTPRLIEGGLSVVIMPASGDLGVRGVQLTHNGRNQLGDGRGIDKMGSKLTPFGVAVIQEMNRLGMMVGVSHLSANGVFHAAEVSKQPIISTHQNLERFVKSKPLVEIMDEEAKVIAKTGGIVGIRYIVHVTLRCSLSAA